jgi:mannosyltransferase OCH1-like enzyme
MKLKEMLNNMIPKKLHQTSKSTTFEERYISKAAKKLMPDYEYKMYSDDENLALVQDVFPEYVTQYLALPAGVIRADIARCIYLFKFGGIYFDTDFKFFKRFPDTYLKHDCVLGVEELNNKSVGGDKLGNAFMCSTKGFELWPAFIKEVFTQYNDGERDIVQLSGPHALTKFINAHPKLKNKIFITPQSVFYPEFNKSKTSAIKTDDTVGVHLCWGSWRNKNIIQTIRNRARRLLSACA